MADNFRFLIIAELAARVCVFQYPSIKLLSFIDHNAGEDDSYSTYQKADSARIPVVNLGIPISGRKIKFDAVRGSSGLIAAEWWHVCRLGRKRVNAIGTDQAMVRGNT